MRSTRAASASIRDGSWLADIALAVALSVALLAYDTAALHTSLREYLSNAWTHYSALGFIVRACGLLAIVAAQSALLWAPLGASWRWRALGWLLFTSATAIEYGYVRITGEVTSAYDVTAAFEHVSLWSAVIPHAIDWRAFPPAAVYALVLAWRRAPAAGGGGRLLAAGLLTIVVHSTYVVAGRLEPSHAGASALASPPSCAAELLARSIVLYAWHGVERWLPGTARAGVAYRASGAPATHIVLVVDESVRGDHFSLNGYGRATTPWLDGLARAGRLANWGIASSAASMSYSSVGSLLTGVSLLPDRERRMLTQPTIFQFAKAMGYETHVLDAETNALRFPLAGDDRAFIDDWMHQIDLGDDLDTDVRIAQRIRTLLARTRGQFIVALKRGTHYPYNLDYPPADAVWRSGAGGSGDLVDSYDNAVRYNVDRFFHALLDADGGLPRTVVVYTSDHADSLTDEWRSFRWGTFAVPLLMLGDARPAIDERYRAAHQNVFATLLDLMQFPAAERPAPYGRSLLAAHAEDVDRREVFAGSPFGEDEYATADFDALKK